jgi:hypothetical protein
MSNNQDAWLKLMSELKLAITQGNTSDPRYQGLQIGGIGTEVTWHSQDVQRNNYLAWTFANTVPTWGLTYLPDAGHEFGHSYGDEWINALEPPAENKQYEQAMLDDTDMLRMTASKRFTASRKIDQEWRAFNQGQQDLPPDEQTSYSDWLTETGFGDEMSRYNQIYDIQREQFAHDAALAGGGWQAIGQARDAYNNDKDPAFRADVKNDQNLIVKLPTWRLTPELGQWLQEAQAGRGTALHIKIDDTTSTSVQSAFGVGGSVGLDIGFLKVNTQGGFQRKEIDTSKTGFELQIDIPAFTAIEVSPGPWYRGDVVELYSKGPYVAGRSASNYFGETGVCALRIERIYVGYQPEGHVTLTDETYRDVTKEWAGQGGVSIGPFTFGGGGSRSQDTVTRHDQTNTISFKSTSLEPQVVAVLSAVMPG